MDKSLLSETKTAIKTAISLKQTFFKPLINSLNLLEEVEKKYDDLLTQLHEHKASSVIGSISKSRV